MQIILSKQAQKYLQKQTGKTRKRLDNALDNLAELTGDIKKIGDMRYRYKIEHFRFLFSVTNDIIYVDAIDIRGNIKYI
jgi:mRNA-degrading endonuclease RelE of RelBE toxin-antitoxin system